MRIKSLKITEAEFTRQVLEYAKLKGWRTAHFRPARTAKGWCTAVQGDGVGFPDIIFIRRTDMLVAELKVGRNNVSTEQMEWLASFQWAGHDSYVWKPSNWAEIQTRLS